MGDSPRSDKPLKVAVKLGDLRPLDARHFDQIDESYLNSVDSKLTRLGPQKTEFTLAIVELRTIPNFPP